MADVPVAEHSIRVLGGDQTTNLSASALIKTGSGDLVGVHVNSSTSGTIKFWDNTAASGTVVINTYSPSVGWNPMPFHFNKGLYMTIGGTLDASVSFS